MSSAGEQRVEYGAGRRGAGRGGVGGGWRGGGGRGAGGVGIGRGAWRVKVGGRGA